ncbi:MAG TPA: TIGR02206 family membrane protein [Vicinamibacteria bacterium]|nr:TIGR02206 family membrane protein [Vicinamibacteria bacterium]
MDQGFVLFGHAHLATLMVIAGATSAAVAAVRHLGSRGARLVRWAMAAALAGAHVTEQLVAWRQGWYAPELLPLQLCDIAALLSVCGLLSLDRRAIEPAYFFALSGTLPALLTPELDVTFPHFRFVVYFVQHGLTVMAPLVLVLGLGLRPGRGGWLRAFLLVNAFALLAAAANAALGTNFMYLCRKPAGSTPFDLFGPWPAYLVVLELLVIVLFRVLQPGPARTLRPFRACPAEVERA